MLSIIVQNIIKLLVILNLKFKKFIVCMKNCFSLIIKFNIDIVKFLINIKLSKVICFLKFNNQFENQRK